LPAGQFFLRICVANVLNPFVPRVHQLCHKTCKTRNALRVHGVRFHKTRDKEPESFLPAAFFLGMKDL
jgi:hypothetical protein